MDKANKERSTLKTSFLFFLWGWRGVVTSISRHTWNIDKVHFLHFLYLLSVLPDCCCEIRYSTKMPSTKKVSPLNVASALLAVS